MSGIKMTSIFGSIINYAILMSIVDFHQIRISYIAVLGDDIDISLPNQEDAVKIFAMYDSMNFPVSIEKSYISQGSISCTEFLRVKTWQFANKINLPMQCYQKCGYALRLLSSLVYSKPWNNAN